MHLESITLHDVIPDVFRSDDSERRRCEASEVWLSLLKFERGRNYLVEAESGRGKSSLCSFIMGLRSDYAGEIAIDGRDVRRFDHKDSFLILNKEGDG